MTPPPLVNGDPRPTETALLAKVERIGDGLPRLSELLSMDFARV